MRTRDRSRPAVLFDLDGTLVDTNYLHTLAWSRALEEVGEWAPMHAVHRLIGMGGDQLLSTLLGHDCPEAAAARPRRYEELAGEARPFPGAAALLRRAARSGLAVVLATSAPAAELDAAWEVLAVDDPERQRLEGVVAARTTADDVASAKPDPEVFETAIDRAGADASRSVAVGDSVWDVEAARAAGLGCIGVESGGFSRHELADAGAVAVYRDVHVLLDQFAYSPLALLVPNAE
ncbi:MAG: HAD family hydrolase [Acidimicrobiales bacterium]